MEDVYDLSKMTLELKSNENLTGFTGFSIEDGAGIREGVLKISSFYRPDGNGYLTLTFIMDVPEDGPAREKLGNRFNTITETTLRPFFADIVETVLRCPMDSLAQSRSWQYDEINIYIKSLKGIERRIIEHQLMPALKQLLPFRFEAMEWWETKPEAIHLVKQAPVKSESESIISTFMKWIRSV